MREVRVCEEGEGKAHLADVGVEEEERRELLCWTLQYFCTRTVQYSTVQCSQQRSGVHDRMGIFRKAEWNESPCDQPPASLQPIRTINIPLRSTPQRPRPGVCTAKPYVPI